MKLNIQEQSRLSEISRKSMPVDSSAMTDEQLAQIERMAKHPYTISNLRKCSVRVAGSEV